MTKEKAKEMLPIITALAEGKIIQVAHHATGEWMDWGWGTSNHRKDLDLDGGAGCYRIKPEPKTVPLGPEDVPPGSVFRPVSFKENEYYNPLHVGMHMISLADTVLFAQEWAQMHEDGWLIKRPGGEWEACHKPA